MISGFWKEDLIIVKEIIKDFYKSKMSAHEDIRFKLDNVEFKPLTNLDNRLRIEPFTMEEVKKAIWNRESSKSLGPDGVSFSFVKKHWELLEKGRIWCSTIFP